MSGRNITINRKTRRICLVVEIFLNYECDYCCFSHFVLKILLRKVADFVLSRKWQPL